MSAVASAANPGTNCPSGNHYGFVCQSASSGAAPDPPATPPPPADPTPDPTPSGPPIPASPTPKLSTARSGGALRFSRA
jgi:hypothetical protein